MRATEIALFSVLVLTACGDSAGDGELDAGTSLDGGVASTDGGSEAPMLYASPEMFQAEELGRMALLPAHRRGPNPLPDDQLSNLPLTVWAPRGATGGLPVVIWSHGGGSRQTPGESGVNWARTFAQAGYAVVAMHHMARSGPDVQQNICGPLGVAPADCDQPTWVPYYESTDRGQDAVAVLDAFSEIAAEFSINLDINRVAIAGHSGGTNAPLYAAGGERNALPPMAPGEQLFKLPQPESRPVAFIAVSPPGAEEAGWTAATLAAMTRPIFSATGAGDMEPQKRVALHDALSGGNKYRMYFNSPQASHSLFNLTVGMGELQPAFRDILASGAVAFLDAYVKDDAAAKAWLASDATKRLIDDLVTEDPAVSSWDIN